VSVNNELKSFRLRAQFPFSGNVRAAGVGAGWALTRG
jgi:hypothetical protein